MGIITAGRTNVRRYAFLFSLLALAVLGTTTVRAVSISINPGLPGTLASDVTIPFNDLNGTALLGQNLTLDFTFSGSEFVRLFTVTTNYEISVRLQTNGSGDVGFLTGTGFLLDQNGNPLQTPQDLGGASSSDASMTAGLLPLLPGDLSRPFDHFGVQFDLLFPNNPSVEVTGGEFRLLAYGDSGPFGIGPGVARDIVPDSGSTLLLFSLALLVLLRNPLSRLQPATRR